MKLLALMSNRDDLIVREVRNVLKDCTVYPLKSLAELEELYGNIPLNLFIIDADSYKLSSLHEFLVKLDDGMVVMIADEKPDKFTLDSLPRSIYDYVLSASIMTELPAVVERAIEKQRLQSEVRLLEQSRNDIQTGDLPVQTRSPEEDNASRVDSFQGMGYRREKIVLNFARMLSVNFDINKLFDYFMDSVMEIARVSKMSIMLGDKKGFCVKTYIGLDPYIADRLLLDKDSPLINSLRKTGRIMHKPVTFTDITSINIKKEMDLLQCAISFPMMHKGKLTGLFNISSKITEEPVYRDEIEIIYVLCNYLAAAVKDIDLYHEIWYQKEFTGNLLSSMNSGMIAIDSNEKITVFNQKASEILNLDSSETVGSDLRELPSPLGDILYETMVTGKLYQRHEAAVSPSKIYLGINSYRLLDDQKKPIGAGIIFSDLSDARKIEEQRRVADKLKAVNDLVAKIAHEVRNPLTSIQTYTQLLNEKFQDDELKNFYVNAVTQSISQLNNLIDKLVTFSGSKDYNFITEDINDVLSQAEEFILKNIPGTHKFLKQLTEKSLYINVDRKYFVKAIYYLVLSIVDRTVEGTYITMTTSEVTDELPSVLITITFSGETALEQGREKLLKPFLDVDHLGSELNVPISHKIIEGHGGRLDMKSEGIINSFMISLPTINITSETASIKGRYISE